MNTEIQAKEEQVAKPKHRKTFEGIVVCAKSDKTISVLVERQYADKTYKKIVKKSKKFLAHSENPDCAEGDLVQIEECRPISKRKSFILKSIVRKSGKGGGK
ncbi:MAG: 30S ribosomal protein S17 [Candidatus Melainabacteria bacterium]|jgi:small subunit ribosomal protein S17